jgi:hypothetical protein
MLLLMLLLLLLLLLRLRLLRQLLYLPQSVMWWSFCVMKLADYQFLHSGEILMMFPPLCALVLWRLLVKHQEWLPLLHSYVGCGI